MTVINKEMAIKKITEMPVEKVSKVLIFMAGMEAESFIDKKSPIWRKVHYIHKRAIINYQFWDNDIENWR